jgi:hypothetical protein
VDDAVVEDQTVKRMQAHGDSDEQRAMN